MNSVDPGARIIQMHSGVRGTEMNRDQLLSPGSFQLIANAMQILIIQRSALVR